MTRNEAYEEFVFREGYKKGKADRPKGEWEEMRNWRNGSFYSRCSESGYFDDERDDLTAYNYCPYCGADMRGEDNE